MTFETLVDRLERLRRLAEIVEAEPYKANLSNILSELEPPQDIKEEVDAKLLANLRQRIGGQTNATRH